MIENHTSEGDLRLLDVLRARGPLDRRTLATMTSTSPATLERAIGRLARAGYVRERTVQATGRGRPPRVVELQPGAGSVVAVDAGASSLRAVLVDLEGRPRRRQTLPIGDRTDRDSLLRDLVQLVDRVIADAPRRPLAVAVGVSGIVDHAAGIVRLSRLTCPG